MSDKSDAQKALHFQALAQPVHEGKAGMCRCSYFNEICKQSVLQVPLRLDKL